MDTMLHASDYISYLLLALIAFTDALIGVGFFVFGEVAFIAAGAMYAASGDWSAALIVVLFGWFGDITSFTLGRRYSVPMSRRLFATAKRRLALRKAKYYLHRYGIAFIVAARFLGPVAWITPFLAGSAGIPLQRFIPAAAVGVILGAGQFIGLGYLTVKGFPFLHNIYQFILLHWVLIMLLTLMFAVFVTIYFFTRSYVAIRIIWGAIGSASLLVAANFLYFFTPVAQATTAQSATPLAINVCYLSQQKLLAVPGFTSLHLPQPINIALLSEEGPQTLMSELGWHKNILFKSGSLKLTEYIGLLLNMTPPISELFFQGRSADVAYQLPGSLSQRVHIRWWQVSTLSGLNLYLGAISTDEEIAIKYYDRIPAIIHDIDRNVDLSRDAFARQVARLRDYNVLGKIKLSVDTPEEMYSDYFSDGKVIIINNTDTKLTSKQHRCFQSQL
jgi:membrane protein DedA with SNARE-associated domain